MEKDMTKGSTLKSILFFTFPLFVGNIFQQFYNMVDTIIVGRYISEDALAAVGSTGSINFLILGFMLGITTGFTILTAQRFGAGDIEGMKKTVGSAIILSIGVTLVLTIVSVLLMRPLLELINTPANIIEDAYTYITIICLGMLTQAIYNLLSSVLRALGNSKVPLYFLVLSAGLNIILDLLFIINFKMGVAGAAIATVIAQGVSGVGCFIYIMKKVPVLKLKREHWKLDLNCVKNQFQNGIPMALQFSITAIGTIMVQAALNKLGSTAVAGYTAASKIEQLVIQSFTAIGVAMATFCAQNKGAGKIDRIRKGVRQSSVICIAFGIISGIVFIYYGKYLVAIFTKEVSVDMMNYAQIYMNVAGSFFAVLGLIFVYRNAMQGMGFGFMPMMAGVAELGSRCIVAVIASGVGSFFGICLANPFAWFAATSLLMVSYAITMKKL